MMIIFLKFSPITREILKISNKQQDSENYMRHIGKKRGGVGSPIREVVQFMCPDQSMFRKSLVRSGRVGSTATFKVKSTVIRR